MADIYNSNLNANSYKTASLGANNLLSYLKEIESAVASLSSGLSNTEGFVGDINGFLPDDTSPNKMDSSTITGRLSALCADTNEILSRLNRVNTSLGTSLGKQ